MGTRADFYIGTGPTAEWVGSVSYDGDPRGAPSQLFKASTEAEFRAAIEVILSDPRRLVTRPSEGWPWPWKDSRTSDYAYAWFCDGTVRLSRFGRPWSTREDHEQRAEIFDSAKLGDDEVRDMSGFTADSATIVAKSGLMFIGGD